MKNEESIKKLFDWTLVRPDISSNWQKVKLMSGQTMVLQLFWQLFKALMEAFDPQVGQTTHWKAYYKSISQTFYTILKTKTSWLSVHNL